MIKKGWLILFIITIFAVITQPTIAQAMGMAKIKATVLDENGKPVNGAHLNIRFSSDSSTVKGRTDEKGVLEVKAFSNDGVILGDVTREGFYESGLVHSFYVTRFGVWQPWGKELTVVMRPIINPVPMYRLDWGEKFPDFGKEIGFDLEKADWVIPYGQGTHEDFIFKVERQFDDNRNYDVRMTLTFSNLHDGIQLIKEDEGGDFNAGSSFRLPRTAPESGYQSKLEKRLSKGSYGRHSDWADDNNYIFRVRSEVDENGNLIKAMYGKIKKDLYIYGSGEISMYYYLNPDYTRNLEFDPERNLFRKLPE
jgi:hypothetical protein